MKNPSILNDESVPPRKPPASSADLYQHNTSSEMSLDPMNPDISDSISDSFESVPPTVDNLEVEMHINAMDNGEFLSWNFFKVREIKPVSRPNGISNDNELTKVSEINDDMKARRLNNLLFL